MRRHFRCRRRRFPPTLSAIAAQSPVEGRYQSGGVRLRAGDRRRTTEGGNEGRRGSNDGAAGCAHERSVRRALCRDLCRSLGANASVWTGTCEQNRDE